MQFIKVKTKAGKVVHVGGRYDYDGSLVTRCPKAKNSAVLVEVDKDTEVTCKGCARISPEVMEVVTQTFAVLAAEIAAETTPTEVSAPEIIGTIRISADMETILNAASHSTSLQTARAAGVSWGAGKLNVTAEGRDALLWFLDMRAEIAREALSDGRPVYPARRAEWHAAVKLNRQASYILAA